MAVVSLTLSPVATILAREYASRIGLIFITGVECDKSGRTMTLFERNKDNPGHRFLIEVRDRNGKNIGSAHIDSHREVLSLFNKTAALVSKHSGVSFAEALRQGDGNFPYQPHSKSSSSKKAA